MIASIGGMKGIATWLENLLQGVNYILIKYVFLFFQCPADWPFKCQNNATRCIYQE